MYLSQVEIDLGNRQKSRDLSHLGAFHNWVERSFPHEFKNNVRSRKLWRIDSTNGKHYLLIVSKIVPDQSKLEQYGVRGTARTKEYDTFLNSLEDGMKVRFRVTLNPVLSVKSEGDQRRGKVFPITSVEKQREFLLERGIKNGFELKEGEFVIVERGFEKVKKENEKTLMLSKATYEGILTILNKEQFYKTLTEGFGKKKAYGFGMMTVISRS